MAPDSWSPPQYERFREERAQPFRDLLDLVRPGPDLRVVDLGCGTGELTAELHARLGARTTLGIDNSPAMLAGSARHAGPSLRFESGDIADFSADGSFDLVFANASLQWIPEHERLIPRLAAALAPGGQLAIQVPANQDQPSHVVGEELAREEPFATALAGTRPTPNNVLRPEEYAALLDRLGFAEQHVRLQVYGHRLACRDEVVEWVRGTYLTGFQSRLSTDVFDEFLARYRERLLPRLADTRPYFYPFKRILIWARRPAEARS